MDQPSAIPRPSGIPRPATSRLPVLRSTGSQSQLRTPASTEQLRKKPSVSSLSRPHPTAPSLQKKTSRVSLSRSSITPTTASAASNPNRASVAPSNRRVSGIPNLGPRASISNNEPVFKRPFARPPSRQASKPTLPTPYSAGREDDALGSLDGFRSASRASSRAGSRAGYHENEPEPDPEPDHALIDEPDPEPAAAKKKSRPSLSERTIESLSQLPSSPAGGKGRRRSSFFNADNSMPPPLRPASAMSSNGSRPTTSDGTLHPIPATPKRFGTSSGRLSMTAPGKRSISIGTPVGTPTRTPSAARPVSTVKKPLSLAHNVQNTPKARPLSESKTMLARTPKARPSLGGVFGQAMSPSGSALAAPSTPNQGQTPIKKTPVTARNISSSSAALRQQIAKAKSVRKSEVADAPVEQSPKTGLSSNALREQIAKAKEAARRAKADTARTGTPSRDSILPDPNEIAGFDFGLDDPFNQGAKGTKSLLRKRIDGARVDGRLNIAAMSLKEIPDDVLNMYTYDPNDNTVAWGEVVDLSSLIAADNDLEALPEAMFPDVDFETLIDSDNGGPQFGGLQNIDLHGNSLRELPIGLKRLSQLSRLNLSRNKLSIDLFDVVSQMTTLRELRLTENDLQGDLPKSVGDLTSLELLEIQNNKLISLPTELRHLTGLRVLNVSSNLLTRIPMELFETGITELVASKNRLDGAFFTITVAPHLQELNLSNNSLKSLCESEAIELPSLKSLNIATNRITSLTVVDSWINLQTLIVAENKLVTFPDGFTALPHIRTADFTANDISRIDEKIALMPLERLILAANPLRERKFLTMSFEDIKRDLSSRLAVADATADVDDLEQQDPVQNMEASGWQVTPSGTLDLSSKGLQVVDESALSMVANDIRQLHLQQNLFESIPAALSQITYLTVLDLSKNSLVTALTTPLSLPKLKDLRLTTNKLTSLGPLITHLDAPLLLALDVSNNRLTGALPTLHTAFPALTSLLASDNRISEMSADALHGLKIVNLSNNDIERLEPKIGLLSDTLTSLNVEGNKFRVPNYHTLQRGTETVLGWLRERIPADAQGPRESWRSDGTVFFDADDGEETF
ncbi:hypothetical protein DE146DRAFT_654079 [Phaeosphaeria sp. MPI-PUGE-AT-0046c]|nr:hypothetical protein DE146DRAFT_654079 [Phaeosphaeria sp. MPI-PUGE-AT-0046c]